MSTFDPLANESHHKDLVIAKLKAEAFELRQKIRDYQSLYDRYNSLKHRYDGMVGMEAQRQYDLQSHLSYSATTQQSLVREVDELKAIYAEQLQRLSQAENSFEAHSQLSENRYILLESAKGSYQRKNGQALGVGQEIKQSSGEVVALKAELSKLTLENQHAHGKIEMAQVDLETTTKEIKRTQSDIERVETQQTNAIRFLEDKIYEEKLAIQSIATHKQTLEQIRQDQAEVDLKREKVTAEINTEQTESKLKTESQERMTTSILEQQRRIAQLEARQDELTANVATLEREVQLVTVEQEEKEQAERCLIANILPLQQHSDVIKKQNFELYAELEVLSKTDDYVRGRLMRCDLGKLKERNYIEITESKMRVERSQSPEKRQHQYGM